MTTTPSRTGPRAGAAVLALTALLGTPGPAAVQSILQAQVLDLTVLEVQVILAGVEPTDEVRCLVRDGSGRARTATTRRVAAGTASGRAAVVSLPLPLLEPGEREFAVTLARGEAVLARTGWRPLVSRP